MRGHFFGRQEIEIGWASQAIVRAASSRSPHRPPLPRLPRRPAWFGDSSLDGCAVSVAELVVEVMKNRSDCIDEQEGLWCLD